MHYIQQVLESIQNQSKGAEVVDIYFQEQAVSNDHFFVTEANLYELMPAAAGMLFCLGKKAAR